MGTGTIFLGTVVLLPAVSVAALRFDWTPAEKTCAATIGIELEKIPSPAGTAFVEQLTWQSDVVVLGSVTEIRTDEGAGYLTLATIQVSDVRKGEVGGRTLTLCLQSGSMGPNAEGKFSSVFVGGEPTVAVGERLVLFLTTSYRVPEEAPTRYLLLPGQYRWFHDHKFVVHDDRVTLPPYDDWSMSIEELLRRVDVSVRVQAGGCKAASD